MPSKTRHVQVRLDSEEYAAVECQAEAEGVSLQELGYRALMNYIDLGKSERGGELVVPGRHQLLEKELRKILAGGNKAAINLLAAACRLAGSAAHKPPK